MLLSPHSWQKRGLSVLLLLCNPKTFPVLLFPLEKKGAGRGLGEPPHPLRDLLRWPADLQEFRSRSASSAPDGAITTRAHGRAPQHHRAPPRRKPPHAWASAWEPFLALWCPLLRKGVPLPTRLSGSCWASASPLGWKDAKASSEPSSPAYRTAEDGGRVSGDGRRRPSCLTQFPWETYVPPFHIMPKVQQFLREPEGHPSFTSSTTGVSPAPSLPPAHQPTSGPSPAPPASA